MSCNTQKTIDIQGHRGCRGLLPENTLEAFKKAIDLGVHTLELDVVVSQDLEVVVSHEPYMNHEICLLPNGKEILEEKEQSYNLYKMSFDSIKAFDCGSKIHKRFPHQTKLKTYKPALVEVIEMAFQKKPTIKFNIELKAAPEYDNVFTPAPKEFVAFVLDVLKTTKSLNHTNLQSFDLRILEEIKKQSPKMPVALLVDENEDIWSKMTKMTFLPEIISPYYKLLDAKMVRNLQEENFKVIPWTVNNVEDMKLMRNYKVDGIITDYPNTLINLLK